MAFGHEGLANCRFFIKNCERSKGLLISIKNVTNISIRRITAVQLILENHEIMSHQTGYNLVNKGLILILFTLFRIYIQNATRYRVESAKMSMRHTNDE
jgi:hypothetical protein